jgi:hypothetical protein
MKTQNPLFPTSILFRVVIFDRLVEVFQPSYRTPLLHKEANIKFTDA